MTATENIEESIQNDYGDLLERFPALTREVNRTLEEKAGEWEQTLAEENPFSSDWNTLQASEKWLTEGKLGNDCLKSSVNQFHEFRAKCQLPDLKSYWNQELSQINDQPGNVNVLPQFLISQWHKSLRDLQSTWKQERLDNLQNETQQEMNDWMDNLNDIADELEKLDLDPEDVFDFASGAGAGGDGPSELSIQNLETLKKWLGTLKKDPGIKDLCKLLGKLKQAKLNKIKRSRTTSSSVSSSNSCEEISGIKFSKELEHLLPSELALLTDPETEIIFDLKYAESRLMGFDMSGIQTVSKKEEIEMPDEEQGPMIIAVDTSGSMYGAPETTAKAITLYMAKTSMKENRNCYVIEFSTKIKTIDLAGSNRLSALMKFLEMSFNGGTDVEPAIEHGTEVMNQEGYRNADMLVVSDFILNDLEPPLVDKIQQAKAKNNSFYSLCIGDHFHSHKNREYFDRKWVYNPDGSSVTELLKFENGKLS
ncbi:hypothetical protein LNTAR_16448 [Lentisphaera araneosa HTCC2155]|uniref:VWFA domain-containing protein n=1 Tax=Lentisphaera araneosa HTCC2155 TaxID=313628 RepID=A6DQA4_9BACT|nr:VWA domain-containing protein [Lentisphaera araneosa]EDM26155.1 hypothetical protein LNTAR_16448 [Lentisphaera araneosa HTCC2155]